MWLLKKPILFCLCFLSIYKFCLHETDGFAVRKISTKQYPTTPIKSPTSIPTGPYRYLGKGAQVYAFVSEDKQYVLKFYRQNRAGHPLSSILPALPPSLKKRLHATVEKRKAKRLKDLSSFELANQYLKTETGIESLHLHPTSSPLRVTIYDKIGAIHKLDLSKMQWIVQKFAEPTYESLESWILQGEEKLAKEQLSALVLLLKTRCEKGIFDKDPDLETNFGFTKEGPIQFDIGRFRLDSTRSNPDVYQNDLIRITDKLCNWLEEKAPILAKHVREEIIRS